MEHEIVADAPEPAEPVAEAEPAARSSPPAPAPKSAT